MINTMGKVSHPSRVALVGMPNCGKTALFNQLTGARQKIANYAGATVERKSGQCILQDNVIDILDLPGVYSFSATSRDEAITRDVCQGQYKGELPPDFIICVVDVTNLQLHLRFAMEVMKLGIPILLALNMVDIAKKRGIFIDNVRLSELLGVPVVSTMAVRKGGIADLLVALSINLKKIENKNFFCSPNFCMGEKNKSLEIRDDLGATDGQMASEAYKINEYVKLILQKCVFIPKNYRELERKIDHFVLHPFIGPLFLLFLLFLVFQAVFSWAEPVKYVIERSISISGDFLLSFVPKGLLRDFIAEGIIAGCGTVLAFLPQILVLFLFIFILEESGYLPRAAFLLDDLMVKCGLSGRSFIPLLSSFACIIPGVMAARNIPDYKDRMITILVAPLATCSARLPIYTLVIGVFIPNKTIFGIFNLPGFVLFLLYGFGLLSICLNALIFKLCIHRSQPSTLLLELPPYRLPRIKDLAISLYHRASIFLRKTTGLLIVLTALLWLLISFPRPPVGTLAPAIEYSLAGKIGHLIEPLFLPLGFNWQIVIALIPTFAAREAIVSALATVYAVTSSNGIDMLGQLSLLISENWGLPTALSLLAWFVFSPQCFSMLAVIRRETNSILLTFVLASYLTILAYLASFFVYQIALLF